jgi:uncharacterized protein YndB with AHSA1/START domain
MTSLRTLAFGVAGVWLAGGFGDHSYAGEADTGPLVQERIISAPVDQVWTAFTTKQALESWMVAHAEIDLRVGGLMRTHYDPEGTLGDPQTIENTILSFHPQRMISIKATKPPASFQWKDAIEKMWSVIYLEPVGPGRTRVTCCGFGYDQSEASQEMRKHFDAGNNWTLDRLEEYFATKVQNPASDRNAGAVGEKHDGDALTLLAKSVGGEWIHESTDENGSVFRVRNVVAYAPDGKSLVARSWLGREDGMFAHGTTQIWREPGTNEIRFQNVNEAGAIGRGRLDRVGERTLVWDWNAYHPDGSVRRFWIDMIFPDDDHYRMVMRYLRGDGTEHEIMNALYKRVDQSPERFLPKSKKVSG